MRRTASILLLLVICGFAVQGGQQQLRGQVVNRDGAAQQCQVDFYDGASLVYRVHTDASGYFYLANPRYGTYRVVILQGGRKHELQVVIDQQGLRPATFVVPW